jgi:autotransporter translocation and assembly factor TamB
VSVLKRPLVRTVLRYLSVSLSVAAAIVAVALVASLTVDLGPGVREYAERTASTQLERQVTIGRLSVRLLTGRFLVENFSISGLRPGDRPFFTAQRLEVSVDWRPALARRPDIRITSVELTDWQMLVEKWQQGHSFPKLTRDDGRPPGGPARFTTTLQHLRAWRGQFTYEDHETPWSIVCPNLDINIGNLPHYHGDAAFTGGIVKIQDYVPMWANMHARFVLDGPMVRVDRIELETDGAKTVSHGDVDFARFPEMKFEVQSRMSFPRMRELFFKDESWRLLGEGDFTGTFHLFKGGHDLAGTFGSPLAGVNKYRFPALYGSLRWTPTAFDVWDAGSELFGGDAQFTYSLKPLGRRQIRPTAHFEFHYADVDVATFTDFQELPGLRFAGAASGQVLLEWPLGRFAENHGDGHLSIAPPAGMQPQGAALAAPGGAAREWGPFAPQPLPRHLPIAAEVAYHWSPDEITFEGGRLATERTNVTFDGTTAWGDRSRFAFHVTSADWQESDQLLAGIITDFGSPTKAVSFGGRGEFDGVMTGSFRGPRVEGDFTGQSIRAWDTTWGDGTAHIVVENGYVKIVDSLVRSGGSQIRADGLFSLGYPRADGGDEIDARFRVARYDLDRLRHAFQIDGYPVSGPLTGEFHLTGAYERPVGFGSMAIDAGTAYGEPFQKATASLRFDGTGVRLDGIEIAKGSGSVTGAAFVGWDSTYSFDVSGQRLPVERIQAMAYPRAPLSGVIEFTAGGSGTFDVPRYDVKFRVNDLFVATESVGQVTGTVALRGNELSGEVDMASPRLAVTGTGRIALTPQADAEITFRFHDSSLDPYVRLFVPKLSPYTTAVASGSVRVVGELANLDHLLVDSTVDSLEMTLFDYAIKNAAPIRLTLDRRQINIGELQVIGEDTRLRLAGTIGLSQNTIELLATGEANLGILQGFLPNVRGAGHAELVAAINGSLDRPVFSGSATIAAGRVRHFSLPNALDAINGSVYFDARGIRLDDLQATLGEGQVQFGGRIGFDGFLPNELNVTVRGTDMHLRYPEGVRSVVDADLALHGSFKAPALSGAVTVKSAVWTRRLDAPGRLFDLGPRRTPPGGAGGGGPAEASVASPLRFDVQLLVPSTLRIDTNLVRMVANADLNLRGTYDRPVLLGHADVERGEVTFEGRRYRVTRGTIDFTNPNRIEPFFDVAAETTVRVPGQSQTAQTYGQTYRVTVSVAGTTDRMVPLFSSDPPLPPADVLALLFGDSRRTQNAELRALQNPNLPQTDILTARATQALTSPLSSEVARVVEQAFGVDTFQLSPSLLDPTSTQIGRVSPTVGLTVAKRISDRAYLTYSRSLNSAQYDQVILLEYDATDRLSWLLSRNEDQTFALEFRVRHAF